MTRNLPVLISRSAIPGLGWVFLSHPHLPGATVALASSHCSPLTGVTFLHASYACFTRLDCFAQHRHPQQQGFSEREMTFWRAGRISQAMEEIHSQKRAAIKQRILKG